MDRSGLSSSQFADTAGIPRPTLSQILSGRNKKISNELITKLHVAFPQLNVLWLMFGDGDMLTDNSVQFSGRQNTPGLFDSDMQETTEQPVSSPKVPEHIIQEKVAEKFESQFKQGQPLSASDKSINYVLVFFTDGSFEVFRPSAN